MILTFYIFHGLRFLMSELDMQSWEFFMKIIRVLKGHFIEVVISKQYLKPNEYIPDGLSCTVSLLQFDRNLFERVCRDTHTDKNRLPSSKQKFNSFSLVKFAVQCYTTVSFRMNYGQWRKQSDNRTKVLQVQNRCAIVCSEEQTPLNSQSTNDRNNNSYSLGVAFSVHRALSAQDVVVGWLVLLLLIWL